MVPRGFIVGFASAFVGKDEAGTLSQWFKDGIECKVEALGIPPYPGRSYPRVLGMVWPADKDETQRTEITYLKGDATTPRGEGFRILAHIVNDRSMIWGAGFGRAVRRKWPGVQEDFAKWAVGCRPEYSLGNIHFSRIDDSLTVAHLVAQHGVGPSRTPPHPLRRAGIVLAKTG